MPTKIAPGTWSAKMSVDEIKTLFDWKLILAGIDDVVVVELNGAKMEFVINQDDEALLRYLNQLPRDMKLDVEYTEDELIFLL